MNELDVFLRRMGKLGLDIELSANYPWIYLRKVNDIIVTEKYMSNHFFTIGMYDINDGGVKMSDTREIFEVIRKYAKVSNLS